MLNDYFLLKKSNTKIRGIFVRIEGKTIFFIIILLVIESAFTSIVMAQDDFLRYINDDKYKHFKNGLLLGMFNSQEDAEAYLAENTINPITGEPYDVAIGFGISGNNIFVKVWEITRVTSDNLSWSPLTNYTKIKGMKFDYLVAHSNGNDIANNAIKAALIKVKNYLALAPPAGFRDEVADLPVESIKIRRTRGDPVAEVLGKKTLLGVLQKFGDIDVGIINGNDELVLGGKISIPLGDNAPTPEIDEKIFDNPQYFTDNPHHYETNANNVVLERMYVLHNAVQTDNSNEKREQLAEELEELLDNFPAAALKFCQELNIPHYSTYRQSGQPQSKTLTEAQIMTEMVRNIKRIIIVGKGPAADLMYKNMVEKVGAKNVKRIYSHPLKHELQKIAAIFGADVILSVAEPQEKHRKVEVDNQETKCEVDSNNTTTFPPGGGGPPGPPGGGGSIRNSDSYYFGDIGGVILNGVAAISNVSENFSLATAGSFSLIFQNRKGVVDIGMLRKFVTALWAVYFNDEGPGISIDPIGYGMDKHLVRYIGKVINTDLGRVMRISDYTMKKWAVGTELPDINGFRNVDRLSATHGIRYLGANRRFWFVPENMRFKLSGSALLFDSGSMALKTEYVFLNKGYQAEPADEAFAHWFTEHYNEIADRYPVFDELFEYAKLVCLARYLKEKGIPMLWFLLANKHLVITEDSPGTVDALAKRSEYFESIEIEGGVDLSIALSDDNYVIDQQAVQVIDKAFEFFSKANSQNSNVLYSRSISLSRDSNIDLTIIDPQLVSLSNSTNVGEKYHIDFSIIQNNKPGLEFVRYYNPDYEGPAIFGNGWHLMIPYEVEPFGENLIEYLNIMIPEKMNVKNLLTGGEEILSFNEKRYNCAAYVPSEISTSNNIALFFLSDASFRLVDKLGNEFQFDQDGYLTEMIFSEDYHVKFKYEYEDINQEHFSVMPYQLKTISNQYENFLNVRIPKYLKVISYINKSEEIFVFNLNNRYATVGYIPMVGNKSKYSILKLLSNGSFILQDINKNEIYFNTSGDFRLLKTKLVKEIHQGNYKVKLDYDFVNGMQRIKEARLIKESAINPLYVSKYQYDSIGELTKIIKQNEQTLLSRVENL